MALLDVVAAIQAKAAALSGVQEAPTNPPESINQSPLAVTYVKNFAQDLMAFRSTNRTVTFVCQIHGARQHLPLDVALMTPYGDTFPAAIWNDFTLGDTVHAINAIRGTFGEMQWAGEQTIGWAFEIDVDLEDSIA